jgi:hypothetical protein
MHACNITRRTTVTKFTRLPVCEFVLTNTESGSTCTMNNVNATGTDVLLQNVFNKTSRGEALTHAEVQLLVRTCNPPYGQQNTFQQNQLMNQIEHALAMNATTGVYRNQMNMYTPTLTGTAAGIAPAAANGNAVSPPNVLNVDSEDSSDSRAVGKLSDDDPFASLHLENTRTMMMPKGTKENMEATVRWQLDQIEINHRKRQFEAFIDNLQCESDHRFYTAVGLMNEPLRAFPGGYVGKSGKRSAAKIEFENQVFSARYDYYIKAGKKDPNRVILSRVVPTTAEEQAEAIRLLQQGTKGDSKKRRSNDSSPGNNK